MSYKVLARSWRPQVFSEVIGQEAVVQTLQNALKSGTVGQAYLFSGLRGVGKTTVARLLAKAVNCEEGPTAEPCDSCVSCREITEGSSMDVVEIDAATNTGVDEIRDLQEMLRYRPVRDRYRVIIVDEVHMLSKSAFNALLKTLEEPPSYIIWIFATTEIHKVLPTILSRCQQLEFRPVSNERIARHLKEIADREGFELSPDAASMVARAAQGSIRDGLSLLDQLRAFSGERVDSEAVEAVLGVPRFESILALLGALANGDAGGGLQILRAEMGAGHDAWVLYQETGRILRLLLSLAINPKIAEDLAEDQRSAALELASSLGLTPLIRMAGLWLEHESLLKMAENRELALDVVCLRLSRWPAVQQLEAILSGETPVPAEGGASSSSAESGGSGGGHRADSPGGKLSSFLWEEKQRRLVGAVEAAEIHLEGEILFLDFAAGSERLADLASGEGREDLKRACRAVFGEKCRIEIRRSNPMNSELGREEILRKLALEDEEVALALRVFGGDLTSVGPDYEIN